MPHRHRHADGSGPAAALGLLLLLLAAGALGGVWYYVKVRSDPAPAARDPEVGVGEFGTVVPWDRVEIEESGEFTMILEAPPHWDLTAEEIEEFLKDVEACRDFASDGLEGFYPEAKGRPVRIRVECPQPPSDDVLKRLRAIARRGGRYKYDLSVQRPDGTMETTPIQKG